MGLSITTHGSNSELSLFCFDDVRLSMFSTGREAIVTMNSELIIQKINLDLSVNSNDLYSCDIRSTSFLILGDILINNVPCIYGVQHNGNIIFVVNYDKSKIYKNVKSTIVKRGEPLCNIPRNTVGWVFLNDDDILAFSIEDPVFTDDVVTLQYPLVSSTRFNRLLHNPSFLHKGNVSLTKIKELPPLSERIRDGVHFLNRDVCTNGRCMDRLKRQESVKYSVFLAMFKYPSDIDYYVEELNKFFNDNNLVTYTTYKLDDVILRSYSNYYYSAEFAVEFSIKESNVGWKYFIMIVLRMLYWSDFDKWVDYIHDNKDKSLWDNLIFCINHLPSIETNWNLVRTGCRGITITKAEYLNNLTDWTTSRTFTNLMR